MDAAPLPRLGAVKQWIAPGDIDSIEWFASAQDICRVYDSLATLAVRPGLSPLAGVLEINDGGLGLDPSRWSTTWFKGGSEPRVLTLTYRATTRSGQSYVVAVLAQNPTAPITASATLELLSVVKSAFALAAQR